MIDTASEVDTETETSRRSSLTEDGDMISVSLLDKYLESDADGDKTPVEGDEYWWYELRKVRLVIDIGDMS